MEGERWHVRTYHDPANVVNPEHADHHIVTPMQYCMVFVTLLVGTADHGRPAAY
jgi:hypothetical protein